MTVSASIVTTTSPIDAATPALRVAAKFRCSSTTTTAPAASAMDCVAWVQRLATTTISELEPERATAHLIASSPRGSSAYSL